MNISIFIVEWAAAECDRQKSGELSVAHMCHAWLYLRGQADKRIEPDLVLTLGMFVEPVTNENGYRRLPVHFSSGEVISASNIPYQIENLCEYSNVLTPVQWYTEFEKIHPFYDGNGRIGALLFNFLSDTMDEPVAPPEVFASPPCL